MPEAWNAPLPPRPLFDRSVSETSLHLRNALASSSLISHHSPPPAGCRTIMGGRWNRLSTTDASRTLDQRASTLSHDTGLVASYDAPVLERIDFLPGGMQNMKGLKHLERAETKTSTDERHAHDIDAEFLFLNRGKKREERVTSSNAKEQGQDLESSWITNSDDSICSGSYKSLIVFDKRQITSSKSADSLLTASLEKKRSVTTGLSRTGLVSSTMLSTDDGEEMKRRNVFADPDGEDDE